MYELIRVGNDKLIGEIIRLEGDSATIQVPASGLLLEEDLALLWLLLCYAVTCAGPAPSQTCLQALAVMLLCGLLQNILLLYVLYLSLV
jgi:hypothetical protein